MKALLLLIILLFGMQALAQERIKSEGTGYRLEADKIYGQDNESFTAEGNVILIFRNSRLTADKAIYYPVTESIIAEGSVTVSDDLQEITADKVTYYLNTETGILEDSTGVIAGQYFVCADSITRVSREYYIAEGLRISTCSGLVPDWSFYFHRAEAELEGYINGTHATANIKNFPILYTPKLFFPIMTERKTGLLIPRLGYNTDLGGYFSEQLFIALDYDKDLTLGLSYFAEKGFMGSAEGRYAISPDSGIYFTVDGLQDRNSPTESDNRWRYVGKSRIKMPADFEFIWDADMSSDFMFMRDMDDFTIYRGSRENERNRENVFHQSLYLRHNGHWSDITLSYDRDMKFRDSRDGFIKTTLTKEPSIMFEKNFINAGPFFFDYRLSWDSIAARNYNYSLGTVISDDTLRYHKTEAMLDMYRAFDLRYLTLVPSLKLNYTRWENFSDEPSTTSDRRDLAFLNKINGGYERFIPEFKLAMNLNEIFRFYGEDGKGKHGILNTIEYVSAPELDQTGLPDYFEDDIITRKNDIAWRIRSFFHYEAWSFNITGRQAYRLDEEDKPLQPLEVDMLLSKQGVFRNNLEFEYDYYTYVNPLGEKTDFSDVTDTLTVYYKNASMMGKYTYSREAVDFNTTLEVAFTITLPKVKSSIGTIWRGRNKFMSWDELAPMETYANVVYLSDCWSLGLEYSTEKYRSITSNNVKMTREHSFYVFVALRGLGESEVRFHRYDENYN